MNTCRVCGDWRPHQYEMVKYSVRHYAHADCAMKKWGADFFNRLTPWQAAHQFPYFAAKDAGFEKELEDRAAMCKE